MVTQIKILSIAMQNVVHYLIYFFILAIQEKLLEENTTSIFLSPFDIGEMILRSHPISGVAREEATASWRTCTWRNPSQGGSS